MLENYKWKNRVARKYYIEGKTVLEPQDDAAYFNLGGKWRMPTNDEWTALLNTKKNTEDYTWTWCDGSAEKYEGTDVEGWKIVRNSTSATLFLPAAGDRVGVTFRRSIGLYWSSTLKKTSESAGCLSFDSEKVRMYVYDLYYGLSIRPVSD